MKTKILKTEQEYTSACERIYKLISSSEGAIEPESPAGYEIEFLLLLVEKYEHEHCLVDKDGIYFNSKMVKRIKQSIKQVEDGKVKKVTTPEEIADLLGL